MVAVRVAIVWVSIGWVAVVVRVAVSVIVGALRALEILALLGWKFGGDGRFNWGVGRSLRGGGDSQEQAEEDCEQQNLLQHQENSWSSLNNMVKSWL